MFKKIASFLFKEEEIVIEEEIAKQEKRDEVSIPGLKALTPTPKETVEPKVAPVSVAEVKPVVEKPVVKEEPVVITETEETLERKTVMITADDDQLKVRPIKKEVRQPIEKEYRRKSIISPIFGGDEKSDEPMKTTPVASKRRKPMTQVISPMFGRVEDESVNAEPTEQQAVMDLDLSEMLSPERTQEDVQVSLYDFLEGLDDHE